MTYDVDFREADVTAVDTATPLVNIGAAAPGNFVVPGNAKYISEIRIHAGPDWTADAAHGFSSAIRISPGGGIASGGELSFGGPCGLTSGASGTSAGQNAAPPEVYQVYLKVKGGGEYSIDGFMLGEDCGSLRVGVTVVYDGPLGPYPLVDADYREASITAVHTVTRLTDRNGATVNSMRPTTSKIGEVRVNAGAIPTTGPIASPVHAQLYGAALISGGNYNFGGHVLYAQDDNTASGDSEVYTSVIYKCGHAFRVKEGTNFDIQAQMIEDDIGTLFPIVTIGYIE
jgi:hypothetical protein